MSIFRTPEIGPETILTLREMLPDDLDAAEDKLYRASDLITVLEHQEIGLFDYYIVHSQKKGAGKTYEIVRFQHFAKCSCKDHEFSGTACKHVVLCMPQVCRKCYAVEVEQRGKTCDGCKDTIRREEISDAPYMVPSVTKPVERVGGIRI